MLKHVDKYSSIQLYSAELINDDAKRKIFASKLPR